MIRNTSLVMFQEWEDSDSTAAIIYLLLEASVFGVTFTMCYVGQILIDEVYVLYYILHTFMISVTRLNFIQGNNVRRMSITIDWYRFPAKEARNLILVIIMSSYPVKLTAGKVVDISLSTYTDVRIQKLDFSIFYIKLILLRSNFIFQIIKATMGYLNMLKKVT